MDLKEKIDNLPKTPGIYMMKDKYGDIIYVGKSKKLKERVKSYFTNSKNHSRKVKRMVKNIEDLDVILTDTELDALLLECEMIKKIRPMYNQLMKNHENYSYIKINKNINYPYIEVSKEIEDDSLYFGPYTMDKKLDEIVNIISREYKTRTCKIMNKCIKYDLNKCVGPCREIILREDYNIIIDKIIKDLNNSNENLINILNKKMQDEISKLNFEKANDINHDIALLKSLSYKQNIINNANENKLILAWINLDNENIKIYIIKGAKLLKSEIIKNEDFELNSLIYKINEKILRNNEDIDEEVVDKYYIDFANIVYSYIKNNKDISYKYI